MKRLIISDLDFITSTDKSSSISGSRLKENGIQALKIISVGIGKKISTSIDLMSQDDLDKLEIKFLGECSCASDTVGGNEVSISFTII